MEHQKSLFLASRFRFPLQASCFLISVSCWETEHRENKQKSKNYGLWKGWLPSCLGCFVVVMTISLRFLSFRNLPVRRIFTLCNSTYHKKLSLEVSQLKLLLCMFCRSAQILPTDIQSLLKEGTSLTEQSSEPRFIVQKFGQNSSLRIQVWHWARVPVRNAEIRK